MKNKKPIKEIVKDPEWQKIRISLLGKWKSQPEWCCKQLENYLGNPKTATEDQLRILGNYLTSSGFRTGRIKPQCAIDLRHIVFAELKRRKLKVEALNIVNSVLT